MKPYSKEYYLIEKINERNESSPIYGALYSGCFEPIEVKEITVKGVLSLIRHKLKGKENV